MTEERLAVVDLGSNSFRLVVFTWVDDSWLRRTDEIHEAVRIGEGLDAAGVLAPEPMERALETVELYAHFCRATGIDDIRAVATSAIRDADQPRRVPRARRRSTCGCSRTEEEAFYGYLAAVNSTTLSDGVALDIGGGSMQLTLVKDREGRDMRSWPFGAVRMTERFLGREARQAQAPEGAARARRATRSTRSPWLGKGGDAGRHRRHGPQPRRRRRAAARSCPAFGVQGFPLRKEVLDEMVDDFAEHVARRARRRSPASSPSAAT